MKTILDWFKKWIWFWLGFLVLIVTWTFAYQYSSYLDIPDSSNWTILSSSSYNQLLANVRDLNNKISNQNSTPIWSIVAWHKNLTWVPALPTGWVECNWQVLSDVTSLLNWKTIPDLNNTPSWYTGGGRFLRWWTTSWVMQEATSTRQADWFISQNLTQYNDWTYAPWNTLRNNTLNWPGAANTNVYARVRPVNMSVVWIMRVK